MDGTHKYSTEEVRHIEIHAGWLHLHKGQNQVKPIQAVRKTGLGVVTGKGGGYARSVLFLDLGITGHKDVFTLWKSHKAVYTNNLCTCILSLQP